MTQIQSDGLDEWLHVSAVKPAPPGNAALLKQTADHQWLDAALLLFVTTVFLVWNHFVHFLGGFACCLCLKESKQNSHHFQRTSTGTPQKEYNQLSQPDCRTSLTPSGNKHLCSGDALLHKLSNLWTAVKTMKRYNPPLYFEQTRVETGFLQLQI